MSGIRYREQGKASSKFSFSLAFNLKKFKLFNERKKEDMVRDGERTVARGLTGSV